MKRGPGGKVNVFGQTIREEERKNLTRRILDTFPCIRLRKEQIMKIMMYLDGSEYTKEAFPLVKTHAKAFRPMWIC
jgi:hypothetical protein